MTISSPTPLIVTRPALIDTWLLPSECSRRIKFEPCREADKKHAVSKKDVVWFSPKTRFEELKYYRPRPWADGVYPIHILLGN